MRGRPAKGRKAKSRSQAAKTSRGRSSKSKKKKTKSRKTKVAAKRKTGRKSPARAAKKKASRKRASRSTGRGGQQKEVLGEGNYTALREFRRDQTGFVQRHKDQIPELGEEAARALEGREGNELRQAEETARSHSFGDED